MPEQKLADDLLLMLEHIDITISYFEEIKTPDDFIITKNGNAFLDAIIMHLQVTGEILKRCYTENIPIFSPHTSVPWDEIIRLRDLISHHYDKLQHDIVFDICKNHVPTLKITLEEILKAI